MSVVILANGPKMKMSGRTVVRTLSGLGSTINSQMVLATKGVRTSKVVSRTNRGVLARGSVMSFVSTNTSIVLLPTPKAIPKVAVRCTNGLVGGTRRGNTLTVAAVKASRRNTSRSAVHRVTLVYGVTNTSVRRVKSDKCVNVTLPRGVATCDITVHKGHRACQEVTVSLLHWQELLLFCGGLLWRGSASF